MKKEYRIKKVMIGKDSGMPWTASYVVLNAFHPNGDCYTEVATLNREVSNLWAPVNQQWGESHIIRLIKDVYPDKDSFSVYNDMVVQAIMDGEVLLARFSLDGEEN